MRGREPEDSNATNLAPTSFGERLSLQNDRCFRTRICTEIIGQGFPCAAVIVLEMHLSDLPGALANHGGFPFVEFNYAHIIPYSY